MSTSYDTRKSPVEEVTFESRFRNKRQWTALFDLGSDEANGRKILDVAWKHNAAILASRTLP